MIIDCVTLVLLDVPCGLLAWIAHLKSVISLRNKFRKENELCAKFLQVLVCALAC